MKLNFQELGTCFLEVVNAGKTFLIQFRISKDRFYDFQKTLHLCCNLGVKSVKKAHHFQHIFQNISYHCFFSMSTTVSWAWQHVFDVKNFIVVHSFFLRKGCE